MPMTELELDHLQMSKVDPKKFEHLDRRSTILLTAARAPTEEQEKNELTAMEQRELACGSIGITSLTLPTSSQLLQPAWTLSEAVSVPLDPSSELDPFVECPVRIPLQAKARLRPVGLLDLLSQALDLVSRIHGDGEDHNRLRIK
jgi:hypothetical protein